MRAITLKIAPGQSQDVAVSGDYVRVKTAGVSVRIEAGLGAVDATVEQGDALNLKPFESLKISHASGVDQTITLLIGNGTSADSAKVGGAIEVTKLPAINEISKLPTPPAQAFAFAQAAPAVGLASAVIRAAKADRRFLMIQNKHATAKIHINLTGAAAAAADGILLSPGAAMVLDVCVPNAEITAISDVDLITVTVAEG